MLILKNILNLIKLTKKLYKYVKTGKLSLIDKLKHSLVFNSLWNRERQREREREV